MNEKQTSSDPPCLEESDPTNARLAALMVEQTGKVLRHLARLEKPISGPSPMPDWPALGFEGLREIMERALREDRELLPEHSRHLFPSGTQEGEVLHTLIRLFAHAIDKELYQGALEPVIPDEIGSVSGDEDEQAEPVIEFTPVSWDEYGKRIEASLAKSAKKEGDMTAMLVAVMAAGLLAATEKGAVALALAKVFAAMIPDGKPMHEIPEGWAPVALAINPATGEFVTLAGPRSEPDGRVEALETMLARQMQASVAGAVGAVREAGRPQPKPRDEARPIAKPRDLARPQPKPGEPDYADYVVAGPLDAGTCESCRNVIGDRVSPNAAGDYLEDLQRDCECENGCRLTVEHEANRWTSALGSRNLEDESEE